MFQIVLRPLYSSPYDYDPRRQPMRVPSPCAILKIVIPATGTLENDGAHMTIVHKQSLIEHPPTPQLGNQTDNVGTILVAGKLLEGLMQLVQNQSKALETQCVCRIGRKGVGDRESRHLAAEGDALNCSRCIQPLPTNGMVSSSPLSVPSFFECPT